MAASITWFAPQWTCWMALEPWPSSSAPDFISQCERFSFAQPKIKFATLLQIIFCWFFITTLTYKEKPLYAKDKKKHKIICTRSCWVANYFLLIFLKFRSYTKTTLYAWDKKNQQKIICMRSCWVANYFLLIFRNDTHIRKNNTICIRFKKINKK